MAERYKVVRWFCDGPRVKRVIKRGLTLEEAQEHCGDPETSSSTCTSAKRKAYTERVGDWFDGYDPDD